MITTKERLNKIFLPYILFTLTAIIIFDIIYYLKFVVHEPMWNIGFVNIGLPLLYLIPIQIIILIWYNRNFSTPKKGKPIAMFFLFYSFSTFSLCTTLPLVRKVNQSIVNVKNVYHIKSENSYYYKINDFYVDTLNIGETYKFSRESRRYGREYYAMTAGFAAPLRHMGNNENKFTYWYYKSYAKSTKNTNVPADFLEVYNAQSRRNFITHAKPEEIKYFEKIPERWISSTMLEAINDSSNRNNKKTIVLVPHYETINEETMKQILYFIAALLVQIGFCLLITFKSIRKNPKKT